MITLKVWFKLENPKDNWTKVSLEEVEYVDNLKKKIKIEMAPKLNTFALSSLTLKATYNNDNSNETVELHEKGELVSVLRLFNIDEMNVKDSFAKNILLFITASPDERQGTANMTYKTLPSWQKTKYDRLADESLKALYLETICEKREKNELNLDIIKVALISLVNILMDVLNKGHNDNESIKTFMLILNAVVGGIQLLIIILKIVMIAYYLKVDISPNIAIYWVDVGLSCSELLLKVSSAQQN
ncbi:1471_t:CDS:2, partial [Rhizophagus irregularis]